jgi:hypothetical protein
VAAVPITSQTRIKRKKRWEDHGVRVFENRVLKRAFGPLREEITGGWRKLHKGALHNLYSSPNQGECNRRALEKIKYI